MQNNFSNKELKLIIQPKVIDHLGIKMYQKPVDVISEFIANAWDADTENVEIFIKKNSILVKDDGIGMSFEECQNHYLTVGRNRRIDSGTEYSKVKRRPVLGRKGIGKFAGFGIANEITIDTFSSETGENVKFKMDINEILNHDQRGSSEKPIKLLKYQLPSNKTMKHGTSVTLSGMSNSTDQSKLESFRQELSRRFLLAHTNDDFQITVNGEELPENFSEQMEFVFPFDLTDEEKKKIPNLMNIDSNGWAEETFKNQIIKWRIGFYEDTIKVEELRGLSIFAKGKLAQKPFFFDITGGISGQNALEYMTGQIQMDFIDAGDCDLIATERQRINLQTDLGSAIRDWGIERIKLLSSIWKKRRSEKRLHELNDRISGFKERLDNLPGTERKTVESVLKKIASFPRLGQARFHEWCSDILTSWETGRIRNLIQEMSLIDDMDETKFIEILSEADVLTALNVAESIKTKIIAVGELKQRVLSQDLENSVRDYIYDHPWLIHPKWESYKKERSVKNLIKDIGNKCLNSEAFRGRVDLALSSGANLLLLEFIRPGIPIDTDHLDRINYYVMDIRNSIESETGNPIRQLESAYVIADEKRDSKLITDRIKQLEDQKIYVLKWETLIEQAIKIWEEHLEIIKQRNPEDKRIQDL